MYKHFKRISFTLCAVFLSGYCTLLANFNHRSIHTHVREIKIIKPHEKVDNSKTLYMRARTFFINGDLEQANEAIGKQITLYPDDEQAVLLKNMIERELFNSADSVRKHRRIDMLSDVAETWKIEALMGSEPGDGASDTDIANTVQSKLFSIIIPHACFINLPISKAIEAISELSVKYDLATDDEGKKGINIVLFGNIDANEPKINLNLRNISLERLLFYVGQSANYRCDYTSDAVIIGDGRTMQEQLETQFFPISRATVIRLTGIQGLNHRSPAKNPLHTIDEEGAIKEFFMRAGIEFSTVQGSNLAFDGSQLIITHNLKNLQRVERILRKYAQGKQVEIEAKFLEVSQGALDELAFRWNIVNRFNNNRGQASTGATVDGVNIDNLRTAAQAFAPVLSTKGNGKIVFNQSGANSQRVDLDNRMPSIPGQLNMGASSVPLGSFLGVIDRAQIGLMIHALEQNSGSDLMSAPKLTVLSGKTANIVVAQELRYPQNYGETHSEVGSGVSTAGVSSAGVTITAGTPRDFTTRNVGVEMSVTPTVEDDENISLQLEPKVTEFEGFMEYGGMSVAVSNGTTVTVPSGFYQPIFSVREIQTEVTVQNGATVIMGGLTREEVKEVQDKVPFLGDIPLVGKLFRSKSETSQKRNLLIFVTARTVSPRGIRYKMSRLQTNFSKILQNSIE